jgi:hypothetical protein
MAKPKADLVRKDLAIPEFSLLGGPLHRLGSRLKLIRDGTNTVRLGIAIGVLAWAVLMLFTLLEGFGPRISSLAVIGVHVRFLVAVPLFFFCETMVVPKMADTRYIVRSGLMAPASLPALASDIRRVGRMKDSWLAEVIFLLAAFAVPLMESTAILPGRTASWALIQHASSGRFSWTNAWYLGFCLPLFRFLMLRWLWRLSFWWYFLFRIEKLDLRLVPTHSDGAAGLGSLDAVHETFGPLILAISAVCSAGFAEDISSGAVTFDSLYSSIRMVLLLNAALFIGPLFLFLRLSFDWAERIHDSGISLSECF